MISAEREAEPSLPAWWRRHRWPFFILVLVTAFQVGVVTRTLGDWWFEDDTPHRAFVRDHEGPLAYFFDPDLVNLLSYGHSVTPWFPFTFWIDAQLSPRAPLTAYAHTAFSLALTACLLYLLMNHWLSRRQSVIIAALWLFLPSTLVITEFLSCRHYLEGLAIACLGVMACLHAIRQGAGLRVPWTWLTAVLFLLACTTKEVYVSAMWFVCVALFLKARSWSGLLLMTLAGFMYTAYRAWTIGLLGKVGAGMGSSVLDGIPEFMMRLPYMLTANGAGYALYGVGLIAAGYGLWRRRLNPWFLLLAAAAVGVMLATIIPVSLHVSVTYREPGTWYRVLFLVNTGVLVTAGTAVARMGRPRIGLALAGLAAVAILWGAADTARHWDHIKGDYRADAEFYLAHPNRVLYSTLPATWYLYGVHQLYFPDQPQHFIGWRLDGATSKETIHRLAEEHDRIWIRRGDEYIADEQLLSIIVQNSAEGIEPLHRPRPE